MNITYMNIKLCIFYKHIKIFKNMNVNKYYI